MIVLLLNLSDLHTGTECPAVGHDSEPAFTCGDGCQGPFEELTLLRLAFSKSIREVGSGKDPKRGLMLDCVGGLIDAGWFA